MFCLPQSYLATKRTIVDASEKVEIAHKHRVVLSE